MAAAHVATTTASTGATGKTSTSLSITKPAGLSVGDVLVLWVVVTGTAVTGLTVSGFTAIDSDTDGAGPPVYGFLLKRQVDGSEGASFSITWTGGAEAVAACAGYSGVSYADLAGQTDVHAGSGTTRTTGTLTTGESALLVTGFGDRNGSTWTGPDTERGEVAITSSASLVLSDSVTAVAAGSLSRTATASATTGAGVSFILTVPDSAPSGVTHVASTQASTGATGKTSTSLSINKPSGVASGDTLLVWAVITGTSITSVSATGLTLIDSDTDGTGPPVWGYLWKREIDGSEGASWSITWTGGGEAVAFATAYRGANYGTLAGQVDVQAAASTSRPTGTLTTTVGTWLVTGWGDRSGSTWAAPDTERQEALITSSASGVIADSNALTTAGSLSRTATASVTTGAGVSFIAALAPSAGSAPTVSLVADVAAAEPGQVVTLTATSSETSVSIVEIDGPDIVLEGTGLSRTYSSPALAASDILTFRATATNTAGSASADVSVTAYASDIFALTDTGWAPVILWAVT